MRPVALEANLPDTFYAGAGRIARFRGTDLPDRPEDWIASTTVRYGHTRSGLSSLPDARLLRDAINSDPRGWLGRAEADAGLLVKLLDAGQRLPLHVHPDRRFARSHLASPYGKTEAWLILDAEPGAHVHLGFRRDVEAEELAGWVRNQDVEAMLGATNTVPVTAGDAVLCPAGTPHAIGAGILLVELQEPTDFSIMLETEGFPITPENALLGLPLETALACVTRAATSDERLYGWRTPAPGSLLPADAEPFFRADELAAGATVTGFAVLVVTAGPGMLSGEWGELPLGRGQTVVVPHAAGPCAVSGSARAVACRPAA
ncbi:MAG TPA: class I mannose-6-phosphate isomerase [Jatrophihabitans sp.]|nr:class I mannose-6-phosphate isomerase [Jatrophihabitans sp.]